MPKAWIETPRGGSEVRARDLARPAMRLVPALERRERLGLGIDGGARGDRKDARLALRRAAAAPALPGPRPPLRVKSGRPIGMSTAIDRVAGKAVDQSGKGRRTRWPAGSPPASAARPRSSRLAAVDAGDRATGGIPMRSSPPVPAGMGEMAQLHHRHRMRQAARIGLELQLVAAALGRAGEDLEHRGGGRSAAPWRPAGRPAAAPGRRRRSGRRARSAAAR